MSVVLAAASAPGVATQIAGSALIGVREGLETGIVVMILVAFLVKSDRRDALRWVWTGVLAAVVMVVAVFAVIHWGTSTVTGLTAEIVAGVASLVAVAIVTTMVLWMRSAAATISGSLRTGLTRALDVGPLAIVALSFLAVGREGIETALLMVGYAENAAGSPWPLIGLLVGVAVAAALTVALYVGAIRIDLARFFRWTGVALIAVAAGILGYGIRALQIGGVVPGGGAVAVDLTSWWDAGSWYGTLVAGVLNLRPDPTVLQLAAWATYLVVVLTLFLRPTRAPAARSATPAPAAS